MKRLIPFLLVGLIACDSATEKPASEPISNASYTKTMVYAVDLNSVFHEDLNDEDYSDVAPITQQLIADVLDGKLKAFDPVSEELITAEQVKSMLVFTDTIWFEEPETGDQSIEIIQRDYSSEFYGLTFKEQWSYDETGSVLDKKIVGLAPRIPVYSSRGGELRGYTSSFWVKYD
ncbi:hypothetical protein OAE48_04310 [Flavobacteriales bacterium]|nr:hypothetical protein [Flavobacteriales bacterium]